MYYPDQITDSPPYKHFHSGPRRHYLNKHLRWEPLPDSREHTDRTFRFADRSRRSQRSLFKYYTLKNSESQQLFLEVDQISEGKLGRSEVAALLFNPSPLLSATKATSDSVADNLLFAVDSDLGTQLTAPAVQLLIGESVPDRTRTKPDDFLVGI